MAKVVASEKSTVKVVPKETAIRVVAITEGYYMGRIIQKGQKFTYRGALKKDGGLPLWVVAEKALAVVKEKNVVSDGLDIEDAGASSEDLHNLQQEKNAEADEKLRQEVAKLPGSGVESSPAKNLV